MKNFSVGIKNLGSHQFPSLLAAYFILFAFLSLILAMAGIFYTLILEIYLIVGFLAILTLFIKNISKIRLNKEMILLVFVLVLAVVIFSYFSSPTIFSGRDQGSLSEAAIRLSQNHKLEFSTPASEEFFNIYHEGKALNFPGFGYTSEGKLITLFPLGYIVWLAAFFSVFGLGGLVLANAISFVLFSLFFYLLSKRMLGKSRAWIVIILTISSFVFSWFFKFTLGENMALMLVWFGIWQLILFLEEKKRFNLVLFLFAFVFLLFVRVEALVFLPIAFFIIWKKSKVDKKIFIPLSILAVIFLADVFFNRFFYFNFGKVIAKPFLESSNPQSSGNLLSELIFSFKVFNVYAILNFLVFGFLGIITLLKNRKFEKLVPFFILAPSLLYLLDPQISNDHPWMLRRFVFTVIPVLILYSVFFLDKFLKRNKLFYIFSIALIAINLLITLQFISFVPNRGLLEKTEEISQNFKDTDLVLIDREATGDAFAMMSGPMNFMFGKQAVYFFNPDDLDRINKENFSNIYFIIPDKNLGFYQSGGLLDKMIPQDDYAIKTKKLSGIINQEINPRTKVSLPEKEEKTVYGKIYLLKK